MEINITLFLQVFLFIILAIFLSLFFFKPLQNLTAKRKIYMIENIRKIQLQYMMIKKYSQERTQLMLIIEKNTNNLNNYRKEKNIQNNNLKFQKIKVAAFIKFREQINHINIHCYNIKMHFLLKTSNVSSNIFYKINSR